MSITHQNKRHPVCHASLILRSKLDTYIAGLVSYNFWATVRGENTLYS